MEMIVCVKQVPNTTEIQMDPRTKTLIREGVASIVNPFDLVALEEALRIKREVGGRITVLSMGPPQAISALKECLARGADRAILLSDQIFAGSDTLATSYTISLAIRTSKLPYDIIFCGLQAIDGDTGQVGPGLAEFLNLPVLPNAVEVRVDEEARSVTIHRKIEEGIEVLRAKLPVLIIADRDLAKPGNLRDDHLKRIEEDAVEIYDFNKLGGTSSDYGLEGSATEVIWIGSPKPIGYLKIDPDLPYQERIRLTLTAGLESKSSKQIVEGKNPLEAVNELVRKLVKDEVIANG
jgi:electron transfer flavoprotein beta subunit